MTSKIEFSVHLSIDDLIERFEELHKDPLGHGDDIDSDRVVELIEALGLFLDTKQCAALSEKFEQWASEE